MPMYKVRYTLYTIPVIDSEWNRMVNAKTAAAEPEAVAMLHIAANTAYPSPWEPGDSAHADEGAAYNARKAFVESSLAPWTVASAPSSVYWLPSGNRHIIITAVMNGANVVTKSFVLRIAGDTANDEFTLSAKLYVRGEVETVP